MGEIYNIILFIVFILHMSTGYSNGDSDYIVELKYKLNNPHAIEHISNNIDKHNITVNNFIQLTNLSDQLNFNQTSDIIGKLNLNATEVLSKSSLKWIYLNASAPLEKYFNDLFVQQFHQDETQQSKTYAILNLNPETIQYETNFDNLNITAEKLNQLNITLDAFFKHNLAVFQEKLIHTSVHEVARHILQNRTTADFLRTANTVSNITINEKVFNELFHEGAPNLDALGAVISKSTVLINKRVFDQLKKTPLYDMFANSINLNKSYLLKIGKNLSNHLMELHFNEQMPTFIQPLGKFTNLNNCTYMTLNQSVHGLKGNYSRGTFVVEKRADFVMGGLLVQDRGLLGLAREDNSTHILFDGFDYNANNTITTSNTPGRNSQDIVKFNLILLILALYSTLFTI